VQTRILVLGLILGLSILLPLMANVWGHTEERRLGYELKQVRRQLAEAQETRRLLRAEEAHLSRLDRIQARAISDMGLQPRLPGDTLVVVESSTEASPGQTAEAKPVKIVLTGVSGAQP
jgi:cell division protein FtsL